MASRMIFGIERDLEMPPRKQVDIGELYEVVEGLAKRETVSVSAMARMLLKIALPRYDNPTKISPQEAQESFEDWGAQEVLKHAIACLNWLASQDSVENAEASEISETPTSIAQVVQQNFWKLRKHNIKNLNAIAEGQPPTQSDIVRISSILNLDQGKLLRLAQQEFEELLKPKPKDKEPT